MEHVMERPNTMLLEDLHQPRVPYSNLSDSQRGAQFALTTRSHALSADLHYARESFSLPCTPHETAEQQAPYK